MNLDNINLNGTWAVVMFNVMCQLDWATGIPKYLVKHLGMSLRVFMNEINI